MIILRQMIILFMLMLIGVILRKKKIFTDEGSRVVSAIVVNVANPCLILSASINKENVVEGRALFFVAGLALLVYVFLVIISFVVIRILRIEENSSGTYKVMTVFSNIGFMGFPLLSAVYGDEALLYASFFLIPYNVLIYTWGIRAMKTKASVDTTDANSGIQWSKIFNIGVVACIVTIIIYLSRIRVPDFIESTVSHLSNLTAPLSMLVIGDSIAKMDFKKLLTDKKLIMFAIIKQLMIPILGVFIAKSFGLEYIMVAVVLVMLSTPVGSMTAMLAQQYDGDYELASKGVALTTVMSVATIPIVSMIVGM